MSFIPKTEAFVSGVPIWQTVHGLETVQGGLALDRTGLTTGSVIPAGNPMTYDESTRLAKPVRFAKMATAAAGGALTYNVEKGHDLQVGNYFAATLGGAAYPITAIDKTTSSLYDIITLGTTIGAVAQGAGVFVSSATGAAAAAYGVPVKGLLYEDCTVEDDKFLSVVVRGTVYARRIPQIPQATKDALTRIIFSDSI